jgi:hypothetical protein
LSRAEHAGNADDSRLQSLGGFGGVADLLNLYNHFVGTPDYLLRTSSATATSLRPPCSLRAAVAEGQRRSWSMPCRVRRISVRKWRPLRKPLPRERPPNRSSADEAWRATARTAPAPAVRLPWRSRFSSATA